MSLLFHGENLMSFIVVMYLTTILFWLRSVTSSLKLDEAKEAEARRKGQPQLRCCSPVNELNSRL